MEPGPEKSAGQATAMASHQQLSRHQFATDDSEQCQQASMQQQQQQQLQLPSNTSKQDTQDTQDDELTMSSDDDRLELGHARGQTNAVEYCEQADSKVSARCADLVGDNLGPARAESDTFVDRATSRSSIERQRLQTGRNRLGTPRHGNSSSSFGSNNNNKPLQPCNASQMVSAEQQQQHLVSGSHCDSGAVAAAEDDETEANHHDESSCQLIDLATTTDQSPSEADGSPVAHCVEQASQLNQNNCNNQQNQQQQYRQTNTMIAPTTQDESELSLASNLNQAPPSYGTATRICASLDVEQLGRQQQQQQQYQPAMPSAGSGQLRADTMATQLSSVQLNCGGVLATSIAQQKQQQAAKNQIDSYGFLKFSGAANATASASASAVQDKDRPQATAGGQVPLSRFDGAAAGPVRASQRQEEGIYATLNVVGLKQQQQQQHARVAPINHVISASASMQHNDQQWAGPLMARPPPQGNQLQQAVLINGASEHLAQAGTPQLNQVSSTSRSAALASACTLPHHHHHRHHHVHCFMASSLSASASASSTLIHTNGRSPYSTLVAPSTDFAQLAQDNEKQITRANAPASTIAALSISSGNGGPLREIGSCVATNSMDNGHADRQQQQQQQNGPTCSTPAANERLARREQHQRKRKRHRSASGQHFRNKAAAAAAGESAAVAGLSALRTLSPGSLHAVCTNDTLAVLALHQEQQKQSNQDVRDSAAKVPIFAHTSRQLAAIATGQSQGDAQTVSSCSLGAIGEQKTISCANINELVPSSGAGAPKSGPRTATISAHCWLIDSSDDDRQKCPRPLPTASGSNYGPPAATGTPRSANSDNEAAHYQQQQLNGRPAAAPIVWVSIGDANKQDTLRSGLSSSLSAGNDKRSAAAAAVAATSRTLRSNTLKLERLQETASGPPSNPISGYRTLGAGQRRRRHHRVVASQCQVNFDGGRQLPALPGASALQTSTGGGHWSDQEADETNGARYEYADTEAGHEAQQPTRASRSNPSSEGVSSMKRTKSGRRDRPVSVSSGAGAGAGAVARLSTVLGFLSNLVRPSKSSGMFSRTSGAVDSASSCCHLEGANEANAASAMPYSLTSGSSVCKSHTGSSSLAYSSSTTSAYVTGSSSLHSHAECGLPLADQQHQIRLVQLNCASMLPAVQCPAAFVDSGQVSLDKGSVKASEQLAPAGPHHSYEYCDHEGAPPAASIDRAYDLRVSASCGRDQIDATNQEQFEQIELDTIRIDRPPSRASSASSPGSHSTSPSERQSVSPVQMVGLGAPGTHHQDQSRRARMLMSDDELISAASDNQRLALAATSLSGRGSAGAVAAAPGLARLNAVTRHRVAASLPAPNRRRWWWNSLKLWLLRQLGPCTQQTRAKIGGAHSSGAGGGPNLHNCPPASPSSSSSTEDLYAGRPGCRRTISTTGPDAPTYRSLKSTARRPERSRADAAGFLSATADTGAPVGSGNRSGGSSRRGPSTLQNIISLAKVDRVFRCRLLASLLVSAILLVLICLLASLIYRSSPYHPNYYSSSAYYHQQNLRMANGGASANNRLSLLIDNSDYDLSWLWPNQEPGQLEGRHAPPQPNQGHEASAEPASEEGPSQDTGGPPAASASSLDNSLKSLLHSIDRSERLQQFMLVMTHLTSLQLARDQFIDVSQISSALLSRPVEGDLNGEETALRTNDTNDSEQPLGARNNNNNNNNNSSSSSSSSGGTHHQLRLSQHDFDLASLTLLSNLHWPLVKWRHQSQQSLAASFLSFALSPTPTISFGGTQTIRNLLSSLILAESLNPQAASSYSNLQQFYRLYTDLRLTSYHLLVCSSVLQVASGTNQWDDDQVPYAEPATELDHIREQFCQLLLARYKRMMITLSQLNHNDLAELHGQQIELPAAIYDPAATIAGSSPSRLNRATSTGRSTTTTTATTTASNNKNILAFLLDRLALLDVRTLAELTLTKLARSPTITPEVASLIGTDHLASTPAGHAETSTSKRLGELIELLVGSNNMVDSFGGVPPIISEQIERNSQHNRPSKPESEATAAGANGGEGDDGGHQSHQSLYDLARTIVGDNPISMMARDHQEPASGDSLQLDEYRARFERLRASGQRNKWYELLVQDLVNPWPTSRLSSLIQVQTYDLFLHPNLTTKLIYGMNKIEFQLARPTRYIVLNCAKLSIVELSLWLKQDQQHLAPRFHQSLQSSSSRPTKNQSAPINVEPLKQIPIRRVLNIERSDQLLIELYDTIEPYSLADSSKSYRQQHQSVNLHDHHSIDFGELPAASVELRADQHHATTTTSSTAKLKLKQTKSFVRNEFVLNISFNKTSLMAEHDTGQDEGVRFVSYADYFAIGATSPSHQVQARHSAESSAPSSSSSSSSSPPLRTLMLTKLASADPSDDPTSGGTSTGSTSKARHLFPCFDEPHLRAKFQLNLVHDHAQQVLFNTPRRERIQYNANGLLQMSVFEQTPIELSPSLISFIVCDLQSIKSLTSRLTSNGDGGGGNRQHWHELDEPLTANQSQAYREHIQVQVWTQFEHLSQAEYASQLIPQLLTFYQAHLNFAYPLEKLDLVAVPKQQRRLAASQKTQSLAVSNGLEEHRRTTGPSLSIGDSMDSLGLLWFKESLLLVDTNLISQDLIERTSLIMSHQLAHQYFGNIIGFSSSSESLPSDHNEQRRPGDSWLVEALCQYLESFALASVQPDWHLDEQYPVTSIQETLQQLDIFDGQQQQLAGAEGPEASSKRVDSVDAEGDQSRLLPASGQDPLQLELPFALAATADGLQQEPVASPMWQSAALAGSDTGKKDLAVVHMLLMNLLPNQESRGRLLRRCLDQFKYKSMAAHQFWAQFGAQLIEEASGERLALDFSGYTATSGTRPVGHWAADSFQETGEGEESNNSTAAEATSGANSPNERIVFIRRTGKPASTANKQQQAGGVPMRKRPQTGAGSRQLGHEHQQDALDDYAFNTAPPTPGPLSTSLADNLELIAHSWLDQRGFPLIVASCYRDRLQLRQERFEFAAKWSSSSSVLPVALAASLPESQQPQAGTETGTEANKLDKTKSSASEETNGSNGYDIWPIPLMFVSRLSLKVPRFIWFNRRETEFHLQADHLFLTTLAQNKSKSQKADYDYAAAASPPAALDSYQPLLLTGAGGQSSGGVGGKFPTQYSWFKLNHNQTSLVRVNYDERNWEALISLLMRSHYSNHALNPLDRANLLDDSMVLMRCGQLSVNLAMNLTLYLELGERDYQPWHTILAHLDGFQALLSQNPLWHRYVLKLIQPISVVIGWKDDGPHLMRKLRRELFNVAIQHGDEKILAKARQDFKKWMRSDSQYLVPNLQELVYMAGVRYGDQQEWFYCWQRYQQLVALDTPSLTGADGAASDANITSFALNQNLGSLSAGQDPNEQLLKAASGQHSHGHHPSGRSANGGVGLNGGNYEQMLMDGTNLVENEKRQLLTALASTQNTWLLEQFLNYSLDSSKIQPHHLKHVVQILGKNPAARLYLWRFVRLNWFNLYERFALQPQEGPQQQGGTATSTNGLVQATNEILETMIFESTKHFATKLDYEEVKTFFDLKYRQFESPQESSVNDATTFAGLYVNWPHSIGRAILQSLSLIEANTYWRDSIEPRLTRWLSHHNNLS